MSRHGRGDSYRPEERAPPRYTDDRYGSYRPPPPNGRAPPQPDMFHFRGQAARDQDRGDNWRPQSPARKGIRDSDFNFRSDVQGPRFQPEARGGNIPRRNRSPPRGPKRDRQWNGFRKRGASDRKLLKSRRETTPERLEGMTEGVAGFKALEDLSDSEADMDLSDASGDESGEENRATKRVRVEDKVSNDNVPKWSNPDPYTALPPPDESQTKKKDVVKLIRKAKVTTEADLPTDHMAADNADFISFDFDDDPEESPRTPLADGPPEPVVLLGPENSRFSHLDNLHPDRFSNSSRPLADRIEDRQDPPRRFKTVNVSVAEAEVGTRKSNGEQSVKLAEVNVDTWPPPNATAAVAGSKRSFNIDEDSSAPPKLDTSGPPKGKKRKRGGEIAGDIIDEWQPNPSRSSTPWCVTDHSLTESMGFWLHKEIRDFYDFVKPHPFEEEVRNDVIRRISDVLTRRHRDGTLYSFGSFSAGIYLPTADMDLVFVSRSFQRRGTPQSMVFCKSRSWMYATMALLVNAGVAREGGEVVWGAKVPILKITDKRTGLRVDISFENLTGVVANGTFQAWKEEFPAMPIIVTLIKQFLLMRDLNEVFSGGIGGFTVTCLVTSLLQHMPAVQSGNMRPEHNLGEILLNFFDLYGNKFNIETTAIQMSPPCYFPKPANGKAGKLMIIDPNKPDNDISGGSRLIKLIQQIFSDAYKSLQQRMASLEKCNIVERRNASILGSILAGDYRSFRVQRDRLWELSEESLDERRLSDRRHRKAVEAAIQHANIHSDDLSWMDTDEHYIQDPSILSFSRPLISGVNHVHVAQLPHCHVPPTSTGPTQQTMVPRPGSPPALYIWNVHNEEEARNLVPHDERSKIRHIEERSINYDFFFASDEENGVYSAKSLRTSGEERSRQVNQAST